MNSQLKAGIALLGITLIWANVPIIAKIVLKDIGPFTFLFLRFAVASITIAPFLLKEKAWKNKNFPKLLLICCLSTLNVTFFIWGIQYTSATVSQVLYATMPLLIIVLSRILWKEEFPLRKVLGVVIGLLGILFIIYLSIIEKGATIAGNFIGNASILIAMINWMFYIMLSKRISPHFSPLTISTFSILVSLPFTFLLFLWESQNSQYSLNLNSNVILGAIYYGFFATTLAYILYQYGIKHSSVLTSSLTSYIQPIFTSVIAMVVLGERLTTNFLFASVLVFAGIFITTFLEIRNRRKMKILLIDKLP